MNALHFYAHQQISEADMLAVDAVLRSDLLTQGPVVERFEEALAEYIGARHAIAVSSGTAALHLAYLAAEIGHMTTSPLTFIATTNAALLAGATVGFVDVDARTGNIAALLPLREEYIVPVHYAGRACDLPTTPDWPCSWKIIEDACQALGAMDFDGCSRVGSCAHSLATVFSFHPTKPITTGEGGAITTNDEGLARVLRSLRDAGRENGLMVRLGTNGRMSDIQAALGLSQLSRCGEMLERRADLVAAYGERMGDLAPEVGQPLYLPEQFDTNAWHLYTARIKNGRRDEIKAKLNAQGIGATVHYSPIVPLHPYYVAKFGYRSGDFPNSEAWAAEELSLPLHAGMTEADVDMVVSALREALR